MEDKRSPEARFEVAGAEEIHRDVSRSDRRFSTHSPDLEWDYIVIGSGMGGMTTAALLSQLGRRVLMLEQHYVPGGFTHTFKRKKWVWDVGVHAVGEVDSRAMIGRILHQLSGGQLEWASLGRVYDEFYFPDLRIDFPDNRRAFADALAEAFPREQHAIDAYFARVREVGTVMRRYYLSRILPSSWAAIADPLLARDAYRLLTRRTGAVLDELSSDARLKTVLTAQWGYYGSPPSRSSFAIHGLVAKHFYRPSNEEILKAHKDTLPPIELFAIDKVSKGGWAGAQKEFFAKLLPAHAESLKGQPLSELDHNMKVKQLEAIFAIPVPLGENFSRSEPIQEVTDEVIEQRFTAEEAKKVGFVPEAAVDWSNEVDASAVDIDLGDEPQPAEPVSASVAAMLDPDAVNQLGPSTSESGEAGEPTKGPQLIDHIKLGFAYQMHLKDEWQKVRLAHVSSGRGFFVFTRGGKHQETISMTSRMLARMCETGRFRAVESAYLMERATQRARKQLAALKAPTKH